jgi:Flp pilus assembly protein TadG
MNRSPRSARRRKGLAIIITALMLTFVIPIVGLAIDAGVLYSVKAKLQSSVDASAMAAARSLSNGLTITEQEASAANRATAFFNANFPDNMMATGAKNISVSVAETSFRTRTVTVNGSVEAPVYFMRVLGFGNTTVRALGKASRRDVNVMLVLDRSGSLQNAGACDDVENAATAFVNLFANQRDRLGLLTFGGSYKVDFAPSQTFKTGGGNMLSKLAAIHPGGCVGWTGSAQALWRTYEEIVAINEPGALNVILFFTDGHPNTITADWRLDMDGADVTRCYDWEHSKTYGQPGWNPTNLTYRGWSAGDDDLAQRSGVRTIDAPAIPVSSESNAVTIPNGYSGTPVAAGSDCWWRRNGSSDFWRDVAYIPDQDIYGNSIWGWKNVNTYSGGAYAGKAREDQNDNFKRAAINAVDNAAQRIRNRELHNGINVLVYALGLGGAGEAEHDLLRRIANDPDSMIYDSSSLEGTYVYAPTPADLNLAFVRIASEILRYAQ